MSVAERVRIEEVTTLSDDWAVLRKTRFSFRRSDGTWQSQTRETYDRGNGATILLYNRVGRTVVLVRQFRLPAFVNGHADLLIENTGWAARRAQRRGGDQGRDRRGDGLPGSAQWRKCSTASQAQAR